MNIHQHEGDLPDSWSCGDTVAIDTEAMGVNPLRDRLCLVQLSSGGEDVDVVHINSKPRIEEGGLVVADKAPNLTRMLADPKVTKLFHYARFDVAILFHHFKVMPRPIWCTKIASKMVRTYTEKHGLKELLRELLGVEISKQQQHSDWGADTLNKRQIAYAASDVFYLHRLKDYLTTVLEREGRLDLAQSCFDFLPTKVKLDLMGWSEEAVFGH